MKSPMHPDMIEATRLTREGRLTEATALLQRMLQSGMEPDARPDGTAAGSPPAGAAPIIELTPEVIEISAPRPAPTRRAEANSDCSQPGPGTPRPGCQCPIGCAVSSRRRAGAA
jgi:pentatricopeptide repeat protein